MSEFGYYCCFFCPKENNSQKKLSDSCPTCNKPYGFPIYNPPKIIDDYKIIQVLGRGFYGCTYLTKWGNLKHDRVLKVIALSSFGCKNLPFEGFVHPLVIVGATLLQAIRPYMSLKPSHLLWQAS